MNLAGVVRGHAVVLAVVEQNIGIRDAGRRAVAHGQWPEEHSAK
jgi:hypothetical protein